MTDRSTTQVNEQDVLRAERDRWQASYRNAVNVLTGIYGLLNPPFLNANGKTYSFENPRANETLQALSDAIRAIPEGLRTQSESAPTTKKWEWPVNTVGRLIDNLSTLPRAMPFYTAYFVEIGGEKVAKTMHPSLSHETVFDGRIQHYSADQKSLVIWAALAPSSAGVAVVAQGPCETTLTPRFQIPDCACGTYEENLGPCLTWWQGAAVGRCVYCEHGLDCHVKLSKMLAMPSAGLRTSCPGLGACLRPECVTRCAIHGEQYIKDISIPLLEALNEPCKGCGKRPIDLIEGEGGTPSSARTAITPWWVPPIRYDKDRGYFLDAAGTLVAVARVAIVDHMQEQIAAAINASTDRSTNK